MRGTQAVLFGNHFFQKWRQSEPVAAGFSLRMRGGRAQAEACAYPSFQALNHTIPNQFA